MALQRDDWIELAWRTLVHHGVENVRVEVLARELQVSKGSFYWHFQNRAELLGELLQRWEDENRQMIDAARAAVTPAERLIRLFDLVREMVRGLGGRLPDPAIFIWSQHDLEAAERVQIVERRRLMYFTEVLCDYGFDAEEAERRAEVCYLAFLGYVERAHRVPQIKLLFQDFSRFLARLLLTMPSTLERLSLPDGLSDAEKGDSND